MLMIVRAVTRIKNTHIVRVRQRILYRPNASHASKKHLELPRNSPKVARVPPRMPSMPHLPLSIGVRWIIIRDNPALMQGVRAPCIGLNIADTCRSPRSCGGGSVSLRDHDDIFALGLDALGVPLYPSLVWNVRNAGKHPAEYEASHGHEAGLFVVDAEVKVLVGSLDEIGIALRLPSEKRGGRVGAAVRLIGDDKINFSRTMEIKGSILVVSTGACGCKPPVEVVIFVVGGVVHGCVAMTCVARVVVAGVGFVGGELP